MRELKEKWLNDFTSIGKEVTVNGEVLKPDTKTSIAIGKVYKLEDSGKNNLKATLKVAGAKYDFAGFLNDNSPVAELLKQAKDKNVPICARFEKKRKKTADPKASIEDLIVDASTARDNIVNIVAGVYNYNTSEWILTDDAVSNPENDPSHIKSELESASYSTEGFFGSETKRVMSDNDPKANHLISMFNFSREQSVETGLGLDIKTSKVLATYLLKACDDLQVQMFDLDEPNYNDYSHTKARSMLFSWMKINPLSKEIMSAKGGFNDWITQFNTESSEVWKWAKEESLN